MTQKEYTSPEFEIEFARAWLKYVEGGKVGIDPHKRWEAFQLQCYGWESRDAMPRFLAGHRYRWKPSPKRMVTIGYKDIIGNEYWKALVAPEREAPELDATAFYISLEGIAITLHWRGTERHVMLLNSGQIFPTREDAHAMADWLAVCRRGGVV